MLTGGLIRQLGELADQLLKGQSHLVVVNGLRVQVDARELLGDEIEQTAFCELDSKPFRSKRLSNSAAEHYRPSATSAQIEADQLPAPSFG